jgi:phosphoribosylformimino-5-aminoimidazole carboxamide ribotide isomerase
MNLYPAIDILGGQAVRLRQGRRQDATVYGVPVEMADRWREAGARWLHVVDLDGAFTGEPQNIDSIASIRMRCPDLQIQVGGGIRDMAAIERLLGTGVDRVILGTVAVSNPDLLGEALTRFGARIAVGIDARDGTVRLHGWTSDAALTALELAAQLEERGVELVIYTDISRDGELGGVNVEATQKMLDATGLRVIASGGVSGRPDIENLQDLGNPRLEGAIIGKALYEGRIDLREILNIGEAGRVG